MDEYIAFKQRPIDENTQKHTKKCTNKISTTQRGHELGCMWKQLSEERNIKRKDLKFNNIFRSTVWLFACRTRRV